MFVAVPVVLSFADLATFKDASPLCLSQICVANSSVGSSLTYFNFAAPEQPLKPGDMAALDVDSSQGDFMQQEEGNGNQVRFLHCELLLFRCPYQNGVYCIYTFQT